MSGRARGIWLCLMAGGFWSIAGVLVRLMEGAGPWEINFYRSVFLTLTVATVVVWRYRGATPAMYRAIGWAGVAGAFFAAGSNLCFILALSLTSVANVLFMLPAGPLFAALFGWIVLRERVMPVTWAAMAVAAAGIAVMVWDGLAGGHLMGSLVALAGCASFAGFVVALRLGRNVDMLPTISLAGCVAGTVALAAGGGAIAVTTQDLALCALLGSVQAAFGLIAFTAGARHLPAVQLSLISQIEIVLGPLWVFLAFGETPTWATLAGGLLIVGAVVGQALAAARARPAPA